MTDEIKQLEADLQEVLTRPLSTKRQSWLDRVPLWASLAAGAAGMSAGMMLIGAGVGLLTGAKF